MLSTGAHTAPWQACLRCQLRLVLRQLRAPTPHSRRPPYRPFSANHTLREQGADVPGTFDDGNSSGHGRRSRDVFYRHINPHGRIIGKPGRKQQQSSEPLAINSLGERSEVIVLRDVYEDKTQGRDTGRKHRDTEDDGSGVPSTKEKVISAEEISAAFTETEATPDNKEVHASIDALRPESSYLEEEEYDTLLNQLLESYNVDQLSRYLHTIVATRQGSSDKSSGVAVFQTSRWAPGRTPIEKRRLRKTPVAKRLESKATKSRIAEKILRLGWKLRIHSEEQQIGELEMQLLPWHIPLLFDLPYDGQLMCTALLDSPLLVRSSEITPYRPSKIMRITARRQDAEEIARQLETELMRAGVLSIDLERVRPLLPEQDRSKKWRDVFRTPDIRIISENTKTIIELPDSGQAAVYGFGNNSRETAGRLLLSLLGLIGYNIESLTLDPQQRPKRKGAKAAVTSPTLVPVFPDAELHLRDRAQAWSRAVQSLRKQRTDGSSDNYDLGFSLESSAQSALSTMLNGPTLAPYSRSVRLPNEGSYWVHGTTIGSASWQAQLGMRLLDTTSSTPSRSIFQHRVPALEPLLTHFTPLASAPAQVFLHFFPSPFTNIGAFAVRNLPTMTLCLDLELPGLRLRDLTANINDRYLQIPLPHLDVDVRLHRNTSLFAKKTILEEDPSLQAFLSRVRAAAAMSGPLRAPRGINFHLPGWMMHSTEQLRAYLKRTHANGDAHKTAELDTWEHDVEVPYVFSHFEQRSGTDFLADSESVPLAGFPNEMKLMLREIDGGLVQGRRMETSLRRRRAEDESVESLAGAAVGIARLITKLGRVGQSSNSEKRVYGTDRSDWNKGEKHDSLKED